MNRADYPCPGCGVRQLILTSTVEQFVTVTGRPLAQVVCPDCGAGKLLPISRRMSSEIDYRQALDRMSESPQERAYARGGGIHPSAVPGACRDVVEGCERLLREVAE